MTKSVLAMLVLAGMATSQAAAQAPVHAQAALRCGWFDNPSPGNASLFDKDGEWTVAIQGGRQATGDWPSFKHGQVVRKGQGTYGFGCACLKAEVDAGEKDVLVILGSETKPLASCRRDPVLKRIEKQLR